jgi:uncharacterized protein YndB with AHSA1/START domain
MLHKISGSIILALALLIVVAWNVHTTLSVEHTFTASEAEVWKLWTDPDSIQKWWGPKGYTGHVVRNDVREGGSYLWAMTSAKGKSFWNTGTYSEIIADRKIVSTLSFADENGKTLLGSQVPVPGHWPDQLTVIVGFSESAGKTKVTVREVGLPLIVYPLSKIGWSQQFAKIQSLL